MDFAPYQDASPEIGRAMSPERNENRSSLGNPTIYPSSQASGFGNTGSARDIEGGRMSLGIFETSLPIRMDIEAMLAYLLFPPAGSALLLLMEHKSDYVRYVKIAAWLLIFHVHYRTKF